MQDLERAARWHRHTVPSGALSGILIRLRNLPGACGAAGGWICLNKGTFQQD